MSFVFDLAVEIQNLGRCPANPANPANSANETGVTGGKLAALATLAGARSQNAKTEGTEAPPGLPGISPEFAARLSAEDLEDIAAGDISLGTVQAFEAAAMAREAEDLKEFFEERSVILEFDAGLARAEAELEAARITSTYAWKRGCLWASLRAALAEYPVLLSQVPDTPGPVDALPLGMAKPAVLKDRRMVRQGTFTGAQVKA